MTTMGTDRQEAGAEPARRATPLGLHIGDSAMRLRAEHDA
jgi:hypothetical protein